MGSCMRHLPFHAGGGRGPKSITWTPAMAKHNSGVSNAVIRLGGTLFFAAIALAVPGKVANWASRAGLALSGSTVLAGAMTLARISLIGNTAVRGFSHLVGR